MTTLTIKNIPDKLRRRLKERAAQHRRSLNGEAIFCLEKVLVGNRMDPHEFLARALSLRDECPACFSPRRSFGPPGALPALRVMVQAPPWS